MRKSVFVIAVIAAACSSVAFAGEVKQDKKAQVPVVKAQTMTDADMDKVTAGYYVSNHGQGGINWNSNVNQHAYDNGFQGQFHNSHAARATCGMIC
jgi:hypothetical protein